jgi:hypothetical protein
MKLAKYHYGPLTVMGLPRVQFMRLERLGIALRFGTRVWYLTRSAPHDGRDG